MDYGPFESLGHEGYSDKVAAEKREETLDRAAARVMENVGDYFRNASNRADFNQRWDFAQKDVRHFVGIEAATTDETMAEVRKRVASLTFSGRKQASTISWSEDTENPGEFIGTFDSAEGKQYVIVYNGNGYELILEGSDAMDDKTIGTYDTVDAAKQAAEGAVTARRRSANRHHRDRLKQAAQWENADHGAQRIEFPPGYWYRVQETFRGDFEVTYNDNDGTPWTMGPYSTMEEAKAESIADAKSRGVYREAKKVAEDYAANHTARRRQAALHWDEVDPKSAYGIDGPVDYYASLGPNVGQYSIREDSDGTFTAYFDNFGSIGAIKSGIATLDEAKSICESHFSVNGIGTRLNPSHVSRRRESRRKRASGSITWSPATIDGITGELGKTTTDGASQYFVIPTRLVNHPNYNPANPWYDLYVFRPRDYMDKFVYLTEGLGSADEAKAWAEDDARQAAPNPDARNPEPNGITLHSSRRASHRRRHAGRDATGATKRASLMWTPDGVGAYAEGPNGTAYEIGKFPGEEYFKIKHFTDLMNGDYTVVDYALTLDEAKTIAEDYAANHTARRKRASGELNWIAEGGFEFAGWNAALPGTAPEDEIGYSILEMDGRYSVYYSNEPQGEEETLADGSITSLEEAKALAEGHYQSHKTARTARRRKQSWAIADDGMTYTSTQVQDSFDCPTCGSGNKLGFSRCACGKQWNSYTINTPNGGQKMLAREVEARPEAILASRRRQARRKRANAEEQVKALGLKSVDGLVGQDGSQYIDNQGRVLNLYLQGDAYAELVDADNNTIVVDFDSSDQAVNALRGVTAQRNKPDLEFIAGWKAAERDRPLRRAVSSETVAGYRAYRKAHVTRR